MFYKIISKVKFLWESTNQHGVHSPFVYDFVTKGLYNKKCQSNDLVDYNQLAHLSKKERKVLTKIVAYFNEHHLHFTVTEKKIVSGENRNTFFFQHLNNIIQIKDLFSLENDFLIIHKIYKNESSLRNWENMIANNDDIVSVNLFYFGIIFYRPKQAKEHFKIRV